ncbi:arm repeat [Cystoisospora suis]|uniref:Arm repeat n=1 Tax=Cystoisospora suis TaxID=483139 RepID=A0A2C6L1Y1_9APIC|nr:arm repeat [Cystoisospora suis]
MADKAVLSALSSLCNNSIRYVDLVQFTYMNRSKKLYLAIGSHALFLVRRDWSRVITGGEILYSLLKNVVDDANNDMNIVLYLDSLELKKKQNKAWVPQEPITITTIGKELLLQWLEVAWSTDFMLRRGRIGTFPRYLAKMTDDEDQKSTQFPIARPFINTQLIYYDSYSFFLHSGFEDRAGGGGVATLQTGSFLDGRGVEVSISFEPPMHVLYLEQLGRENIRYVAAGWKKALLESALQTRLMRSEQYMKRMNLSDDPSAWSAWQLWVKTETHNVVCILLRRAYVPPMMDFAHDMTVLFRVSYEDQREYRIKDTDFLKEAEFTADSISPTSQANVWLREILQAKLDALIFQPEQYTWFARHLKMHRREEGAGREGQGLGEEQGRDVSASSRQKKKMDLNDEEIEAALLDSGLTSQEITAYHSWSMQSERESESLKLLAAVFSSSLIRHIKGGEGQKIRDIFAFLLHLRPRNMMLRWSPDSLKNVKTALKKHDYIFNDRVFVPLVECGFIAKLFSKGEENAYLDLLKVLLLGATSLGLKTVLCRQILKASAEKRQAQGGSAEALYTIVPALVNVIRNKTTSTSVRFSPSFFFQNDMGSKRNER